MSEFCEIWTFVSMQMNVAHAVFTIG